MINNQIENSMFSFGTFTWWFGVVEDRKDPEMLGRVKVRVLGFNSGDIPKDDLIWAFPVLPVTSAAMSGVGDSPTGILEGTWVMGFYRDGQDAQDPVILGTIPGKPSGKSGFSGEAGFKDEEGTYPRDEFLGQSDVNLLARNPKTEGEDDEEPDSILKKQKDGETQKVPIALQGLSRQQAQPKQHKKDEEEKKLWTEKVTSYNAKYPFNHVYETERGLIEEWDDTEGAERYKRWHRCGTFLEEHTDGDVVRRIKRNNYELLLGENYVQIIGDCAITIGAGEDFKEIEEDKMDYEDNVENGDKPHCDHIPEVWEDEEYKKKWEKERKVDKSSFSLLVKGDVNLEVEGNHYQKVHGKTEIYSEGDLHLKSGSGTVYIDGGPYIHLNKPGSPTLEVEGIGKPDWESNEKGRKEEDEE